MGATGLIARCASAFITAGIILFTAATPALAAPPPNDTFGNAVVITSTPFRTSLDTTEATTDTVDEEANAQCGAPATAASVWYTYTAAEDGAFVLNMAGSSYTGGFLIVTGVPGSLEVVNCGPNAVAFEAEAGTTYHIMVLDDDDTQIGGQLTFVMEAAPPPPDVTLTVDPTGSFDSESGSVNVHGTVSCAGLVEFSFLVVELEQRVGRGVVYGGTDIDLACDGITRPWTATISPILGDKFTGGKAATFTFAVACGPVFCFEGFEETTIQIKRNG